MSHMRTRREMNGNTAVHNVHQTGRRKTGREKSDKRHLGPINNNSTYNFDTLNNCPSSYYPNNSHNTSMFPAVSDPSLGYPYNLSYQMTFEPMSLPNYNPYQPLYRNHPCSAVNNPPQTMNYFKNTNQQVSDDQFASLPFPNNDLTNGDSKRRFSDPGIPNDCDTDDSSKQDQIVQNLVEQVNYLKDSNRRLYRELQEMRGELNFLKQRTSARFYDKEYEPGMLSDIVREIRDAARVREEALLSRVKHIIEEGQMAMSHVQLIMEKTSYNDRLGKLEEQIKNFCLNNSLREDGRGDHNSSNSAEQVLELEQVNLGLRRELQEALAGKKDADAKIIHINQILDDSLDQMLTSLHHQKSSNSNNELATSSDDVKNTSSVENCSITTKSASPNARVVMSGPVTSL